MKLSDVDIMALLPAFMRSDNAVQGLANGVNALVRALAARIMLLRTWDQIDHMSEAELDELAWELDATWYSKDASIEAKREILKKSDLIHAKLGTKWAVEQVISAYFGDGIVQEWFEYGGEPYRFKVIISNASVTKEQAGLFLKALNAVKNMRSHLEQIVISLSGEMPLYYAGVVHTGDFLEIRQVV